MTISLESVIKAMAYEIKEAIVKNLQEQGHTLTGALEDSIEIRVEAFTGQAIAEFWMNDYGIPLDTGVPSSNIPYNPGSGAKRSKYIEGLTDFVRKRGIASGRDAVSVAFAIARKHKNEGMPTRGSLSFSRTGKRTGWFSEVLTNKEKETVDAAEKDMQKQFDLYIEDLIR